MPLPTKPSVQDLGLWLLAATVDDNPSMVFKSFLAFGVKADQKKDLQHEKLVGG